MAVTSIGKNLNSNVSSVFGRSPDFIMVDLENGEIKDISTIENPAKNENGAGNLAAQFMVDSKVKALISGELGPVAFHILKNAGIKVYNIKTSLSVEKNLKRFNEGRLEEITSLSSGYPI